MLDNILTEDIYVKILQNLYNTTEIEFISAEFEQISEHVEGFMGEHNNINVTFKLRDVTTTEVLFIKKRPNKHKLQIEMSVEFDAYNKEIFMYDYLLKEYEKDGSDTSFAPKCYYVKADELLILENLKRKGFEISDRHSSFNMAQIKCALKTLAMFHGAGIVHTMKKSKELKRDYSLLDEYPEMFKERLYIMEIDPNGFAMKFWNGSYKLFRSIIQLLPGSDEYKEKFTSMVFKHKFGEVFCKPSKYLKTVGHGDLWSNNMMFKYENGEVKECRLLDYQVVRYFYPAFDVLLMIHGNTTPSFRKENLPEIFKQYYDCLASVVEKHGCNINELMSFSEFLESVKLVKRDAMLQANYALAGVHLPKEYLNSVARDSDPEKMEEFFFDNADVCAEAFKTNENYRNVLTAIYQEYYDILLDYE